MPTDCGNVYIQRLHIYGCQLNMACVLACAIWDHAEKLTMATLDDPSILVAKCYKWTMARMQHTYADPWEDLLAQVWGV